MSPSVPHSPYCHHATLGGSWAVAGGVISPVTWAVTTVTALITPLITAHEPPSP